MLLLFLQYCCLFIWWEWKRVVCLRITFVHDLFFCFHSPDWVSWALCLISMHHPMILFLSPQYCCLLIGWELKSGMLMDTICIVSFIFCSQLKSSWVSVVFVFSVSLSDLTTASPILFPVGLMRIEMSGLLMVFIVCCFFCIYRIDWVQWVLCLISVHHSMMLHLFL